MPELSPNNTMKLDIIAKDGSCISMNALRDDTKCAYRYDFEAGKAIKQTQYYYVDGKTKHKISVVVWIYKALNTPCNFTKMTANAPYRPRAIKVMVWGKLRPSN
ncbi:hypothetical protein HpCHC98_06910 [Helicobacter pylori]